MQACLRDNAAVKSAQPASMVANPMMMARFRIVSPLLEEYAPPSYNGVESTLTAKCLIAKCLIERIESIEEERLRKAHSPHLGPTVPKIRDIPKRKGSPP
jgi:hypothetical protein